VLTKNITAEKHMLLVHKDYLRTKYILLNFQKKHKIKFDA